MVEGTGAYTLIASMLSGSKVDQISIEGAHQPLDLEILQKLGDKDIVFGPVDIEEPRVETVEEIEGRVRQVPHRIEPGRLFSAPDCSMIYLEPAVARAKLTNLVEAARRVRESL